MKIHPLALGTLHMTEEMLHGQGGSPDKVIDAPTWAVLIETENALVLVDCGCQQQPRVDPAAEHIYSFRPEELLTAQLARFGHTPEDVTHLVLTHSHVDHAGNTFLFKKAGIYIDAAEYAGALQDKAAYLAGQRPGAPLQHLTRWDDSLHFRPVEAPRTQLLPGITLVRFPRGHAYGFLAVVISGKPGNLILASDLAYTPDALTKRPPTLVTDPAGYLRGIDLLRDLAEEFPGEIWYGHCPEQFAAIRDTTLEY